MFKVLHVFNISIPIHAGYTFRSRAILTQQRALGWKTFHVTSSKHASDQADEVVDGFQFFRTQGSFLKNIPILGQWDVVRTLKPQIRRLVKEHQIEVIHAHSPCLNGLAAIAVGRELGIPVVYECRAFWEDAAVDTGAAVEGDLRYRAARALATKVFKQVDAVFCIAAGLIEDVKARGVLAENISMVPNAVDTKQFSSQQVRDSDLESQLKLSGKTVLGFFGSFYAYEGIAQAIDALPTIAKSIPSIHLLLVGGGNEEANLKEQVKKLGLESMVTFTGRVPHQQIPRYASLVDAFIFPRQAMRLTHLVTPLKPLESMAQGKLVIASDVGGHKELIEHNKTGYLFRADDAQSLASVTVQALTDTEAKSRMIKAGFEFVETERTWQAIAKRYEVIYRKVIAKKKITA